MRSTGLWFRSHNSGFKIQDLGYRIELFAFRAKKFKFRASKGLGFIAQVFMVQVTIKDLQFSVQGSGLRVEGRGDVGSN
jgi:hypothetical protein